MNYWRVSSRDGFLWLGGKYGGGTEDVTFPLWNWLLEDGPWNDDPPYPYPWGDFHESLGWFCPPGLYVLLNGLLLGLGLRNVLSTFDCSTLIIGNPGHCSTKWSWLPQRTQTGDTTGLMVQELKIVLHYLILMLTLKIRVDFMYTTPVSGSVSWGSKLLIINTNRLPF